VFREIIWIVTGTIRRPRCAQQHIEQPVVAVDEFAHASPQPHGPRAKKMPAQDGMLAPAVLPGITSS
jgi:hypothetical protein